MKIQKRPMTSVLFVERLANDCESLQNQFVRSFSLLSLADDFDHSKGVFIKPNLTHPVYEKGVTTQKEFVESLVSALRQINSETQIYIGEGEGGYNSFPMTEALGGMGFFDLENRFPNVNIVNLSRLPSRKVEVEAKGKPYFIDLPELFFDEVDFSITCPVPKVHCMTKVTLSFKNQWGCLPDMMRLKNHYVFDETIGQICNKLKFRYAFLDGKYGLDNNGPIVGKPKRVGWFVASNSLGAFDMIVCEMMGIDWKEVSHIVHAKKRGFVADRGQIKIVGDIDSLRDKFYLKRNFWNYLALIAFHSKFLTNLVYLSWYGGIIRDVMYTFKKRPMQE